MPSTVYSPCTARIQNGNLTGQISWRMESSWVRTIVPAKRPWKASPGAASRPACRNSRKTDPALLWIAHHEPQPGSNRSVLSSQIWVRLAHSDSERLLPSAGSRKGRHRYSGANALCRVLARSVPPGRPVGDHRSRNRIISRGSKSSSRDSTTGFLSACGVPASRSASGVKTRRRAGWRFDQCRDTRTVARMGTRKLGALATDQVDGKGSLAGRYAHADFAARISSTRSPIISGEVANIWQREG